MEMIKRVKQPLLYLLVKEEIYRFITDKKLEKGDMLPSESDLCTKLGVSRGTLREAMRALEEEDVVIRKQGIGTFVTQSNYPIHSTLDLNEGVSEMIKGKGMVPGSLDTSIEEIPADKKIAKRLGAEPGETLFVIKRIRTANGAPVAYTEDFLRKVLIPESHAAYLNEESLYGMLEQRLGFELGTSMLRLKPVKADKALAESLGIKQGDLLMCLQQTDMDSNRNPILYSEEYFVSERFEFLVMRKRRMRISRAL